MLYHNLKLNATTILLPLNFSVKSTFVATSRREKVFRDKFFSFVAQLFVSQPLRDEF